MHKYTLKLCLFQFAAFTSYISAQEVLLTKAQVPNDPFDLESKLNDTTSETQNYFTEDQLSVLEKINFQDLHQSSRRLADPGDIAVGKTATWNVGTPGQPGAGSIVGKAISQAQARAAAGQQVFYAAGSAFLPQSTGRIAAKPDFVVPLNQLQMAQDGAKQLLFLLDVTTQGKYPANVTKCYKTICFLAYPAETRTMVINIQGIPYLVNQITTREAFATNATLVWDGGIAYRYLDYAVDTSYAGSTSDLNNPRICYGSTPCYTDISPTTVEDPTQVNATAIQLGPIWWGGNLDTSIKQIINLSGQTVFSTSLDLASAWQSTDTVIWMGLSPYRVDYPLPTNNTYSTIQANLSAIGICFGFETCVGGLARVRVEDPTAENDTVKCIGNTCFTYTLQPRVEQIIKLDDQTMLISPYDYETAWNTSGFVIWHGFVPYQAQASIPDNEFVTLQPDVDIRICSGEGIVNCYLNPTHTPADSATEASYCLTDDKDNCYDGPVDTASYVIYQIGKATAIGQLNPLEQTWFSNLPVIWNNQTDGWTLVQILPADNTFSTVTVNLADPLLQISPSDYTILYFNIVELEEAKEGDEGVAFCLGDFCFSAEQDFNRYEVIQLGDLYFEVSNITVADAWSSTEKIIWIGYTPYVYITQFDSSLAFSTQQPDQAEVEFCFSGVCYMNLAAVDMTDEEAATTSIGCLDETNGICFSGEVDPKNYQIAAIDGFAVPVVQVPFADARESGDIIIWDSSFNSWQPQGVFSDNSYTTIEVDITTIIAQVSGTKYNSIVQVDPEDADATAASLWCWQSTCYSGTEISVDLASYCLNYEDASYCFITSQCPDGDCSSQQTLTDADGTVVLLANLPSEAKDTADKAVGPEVTICSVDQTCVKDVTVSAEPNEDGSSVCLESLALCFSGSPAEAPAPVVVEEVYVPPEPEQLKNVVECGAFCEEQQVVLCIDSDCMYAALHTFDTAWNDDTESDYIWAGTNSFSYLSLATEAGDASINVTLADVVVARFGVATGARFDDNTINLMTLAEDPFASDSYCFETLCYTFIPYVYPVEDIIMFDDAGIAAIVQQVSARTAWVSPYLVFWNHNAGTYMTPHRFVGWVPTATIPTYNYNLADLKLSDENNVNYVGATLTTPEDEAGMCFEGNCFLATVDTNDYQIASFGTYTPLVIQMAYTDAYLSEMTTYFYKSDEESEPKGAQMLYDVPDHDWFTITIDQTTVIMCVGNGVTNCYSELEETTFDGVPPEGKELVEIPELGLWVFALPTPFPYSEPLVTPADCPDAYIPVNVTLCIDDLCYIALNESFSTAWNDESTTAFTWVGMQPYVIYETTSGDESSVYVGIGDVVQCQPGSAGQRFDATCVTLIDYNAEAFENSEDGTITCVAFMCYNSQPFEAPNEYVASFNDFGIKLLVNQLTLADAWYSGETVIWAGLNPHQLVGQVPFITTQNVDLNLFECSVCYGSTSCYVNIQAFDPNYPPVDDQASLYLGDQNFVADLDTTTYDIATVDDMCILVQTQAFSDAWVSLNEIIWVGGMGYRGLDTIPDTSFSTLSWTLQDLVVCIPGGKICVNNIRRVNPRETPKKNTYIIKLGTNIYNSDVFNKGATQPLPAESRQDVQCAQGVASEEPVEEVPVEEVPVEEEPVEEEVIEEETPVEEEVIEEETPVEEEFIEEEMLAFKKKKQTKTHHIKYEVHPTKKNQKAPSVKKHHEAVAHESPKKVNVKHSEAKKPAANKSEKAKKTVEVKKLVPLKSGIVNLMATHVDNSTNMTKSDTVQERMRMTFRDYFMYALSGKTSDPSRAGQCSIQCFSLPTFCCASINSLDASTGLTSFDNLCMNKQVVNSQSSIKLGSVEYSLKCSDDTQAVSGATLIKSTFLVIVAAIGLIASI